MNGESQQQMAVCESASCSRQFLPMKKSTIAIGQ